MTRRSVAGFLGELRCFCGIQEQLPTCGRHHRLNATGLLQGSLPDKGNPFNAQGRRPGSSRVGPPLTGICRNRRERSSAFALYDPLGGLCESAANSQTEQCRLSSCRMLILFQFDLGLAGPELSQASRTQSVRHRPMCNHTSYPHRSIAGLSTGNTGASTSRYRCQRPTAFLFRGSTTCA